MRNQVSIGRWDLLFLFRTGWGVRYEWLAMKWAEQGPEGAPTPYVYYKLGPIEIRRRAG